MNSMGVIQNRELTRVDDNCWAFNLNNNTYRIEAKNYQLAKLVSDKISSISVENLHFNNHTPKILTDPSMGRITLKVVKHSTRFTRFLAKLPFFQVPERVDITQIKVTTQKKSQLKIAKLNLPCLDLSKDSTIQSRLQNTPFTDAFTRLSTDAFQHFEKQFISQSKINSKYRIVVEGSNLRLRSNKSPISDYQKEENRKTVQHYKSFIIEEYGLDLINYVQHNYGLNFDKMIEAGQPLCPEHVYRINIGVNNIEIQDVAILLNKLRNLSEILKKQPRNKLLKDFLKNEIERNGNQSLTIREARALLNNVGKYSKSTTPNINHLENYLNSLKLENIFSQKKLDDNNPKALVKKPLVEYISSEQLNALISILAVPKEHKDNLYTGRKIIGTPIMGYYTLAESKKFKPWIDQQEMLQVFDDIQSHNNAWKENDNWKNFYEIASHVLCKKHLTRAHPTEKWRVGALIPAPLDAQGKAQWYMVNSCTDNNEGNLNYTLLPLGDSKKMPAVKLFRSTAGSKYAMSGLSTIEADLYPFDSPGYLGRFKTNKQEKPFIDERTIPVWVGYYLKGKQSLDDLAKTSMSPAQEAKQLIGIISDLEKGLENLSKYRDKKFNQTFYKILKKMNHALLDIITGAFIFRSTEASLLMKKLYLKIKGSDAKTVQGRKEWKQAIASWKTKSSGDDVANLQSLRNYARGAQDLLYTYAKASQELPEYKRADDVVFVGHSLGGALAQANLCHLGINRGRIPLPNKNYGCYASDAPGISKKDNWNFLDFGNEHKKLLYFMKQRIKITQQMEYGDFVSSGGKTHLGATKADESLYSGWLKMDISIFKPLKTSVIKEIRDAPCAHARRIGLGTEGIDYNLYRLTPKKLYKFDGTAKLNPKLRAFWGFKIFLGPRMAEFFRIALAYLSFIPRRIIRAIKSHTEPGREDSSRDRRLRFHVLYKESPIGP